MLKDKHRRMGIAAVLPLQLIRISSKQRFFSELAISDQPERTVQRFLQGRRMSGKPHLRFFKQAAELRIIMP